MQSNRTGCVCDTTRRAGPNRSRYAIGTSTSKTAGDPYLLMSIAAVVIGGTSILGGRGKYIGTIGGALVLTVLINVLTVENISEAGRMMIQGLLILVLLIAYASTEP